MSADARDVAFEPFFLEAGPMRLFCVFFPAAAASKGNYLFVPPFAEEMNRSRSMVAMQARALAARGFGVLLVDLFGTGDSSGEFGEATWASWQASVLAGYRWLNDHGGGCRGIWGLRLGALLAAELVDSQSIAVDHAVFWQPVVNAKSMLTQFLRIRVAAAMDLKVPSPSTDEMRASFKAGQSVEIGGYEVNPELALALDALSFAERRALAGAAVDWIEVSPTENAELTAASSKAIEALRGNGARITASVCEGPSFWQQHERTYAPKLIDVTTERVLQHHG